MSIMNFYVWIFTTMMGVAQKAFGTVTGGDLAQVVIKHVHSAWCVDCLRHSGTVFCTRKEGGGEFR
jgi:hypothetical protein